MDDLGIETSRSVIANELRTCIGTFRLLNAVPSLSVTNLRTLILVLHYVYVWN